MRVVHLSSSDQPCAAKPSGQALPHGAAAPVLRQPAAAPNSCDGLREAPSSSGAVRDMPQLKSIDTLAGVWQLWDKGSGIDGPLKRLAEPDSRRKGFKRQRFHEWKHFADEVARQAAESHSSAESAVQGMEAARLAQGTSVAAYVRRFSRKA